MRSGLRLKRFLPLFALAAVLLAGASLLPAVATGGPPAPPQGSPVQASGPVTPGVFTGDLRSLPRAQEWKPGDPIKEIPQRAVGSSGLEHTPEPRGYGMDPLAELQARIPAREGRTFSSSSLNFDGMGFTGVYPPDPVGDVGRDYYIQMVNGAGGSQFAVYNKADGSLAAGPFVLDSIGSGLAPCELGFADPIVLYDHLAGRWLLSEISSAGNTMCVYISKTSDPIGGGWFVYAFSMPTFPDYPKYGVWPDAYYVSTNQDPPAAHALERTQMLQGLPATYQTLTALPLSGFAIQALTPADLDGDEPPPPGAPGIFMRHYDTEAHGPPGVPVDMLELYQFHVDWGTPANSTFAFSAIINVSEFDSDLCGLTFPRECFEQPGSTVLLDPFREVIMWRLVYRNFGTHESLIGNFVTDVTGADNGGIRWFEVRRQPAGAGLRGMSYWNLHQEGTYIAGELTLNHWMGSIAMDGAGNIALGCNVVNSAVYPGLRLDGRLWSDPLGVMTNGATPIAEGAGANPNSRYGDYNALTLDPVDDCTFWFTGEYNPTSSWGTRIATFRFDRCPKELEIFVGEEEDEDPERSHPAETKEPGKRRGEPGSGKR